MTDSQLYDHQAEAVALSGLTVEQYAEARSYIHRIVQDWLQQADEDPALEREDLMAIGLEDLQNYLEGKAGASRLAALQFLALKPQVEQTSARAFILATQVYDQKITKEDAAPEAQKLRGQIFQLIPEVKVLDDPDRKRWLMRELADADLEIRYVIEDEEGAISIRLNHYING